MRSGLGSSPDGYPYLTLAHGFSIEKLNKRLQTTHQHRESRAMERKRVIKQKNRKTTHRPAGYAKNK